MKENTLLKYMRLEYQKPTERQLSNAQPLLDLLFQEDNSHHVVTWFSLAQNPKFSFYSRSVIHHMIEDINEALNQQHLQYRVFCDPTGIRSLGLGIVDIQRNDLIQRLEQQSSQELTEYVTNNSKEPLYEIDNWLLSIPRIDTKQFPSIYPVIAIFPKKGTSKIVYIRSENIQHMLQTFMSQGGYIDRTHWPAALDYDYSIDYLKKALDTITPRKNSHSFIEHLRTAGYSLYGETQRRIMIIRDALESTQGQHILEDNHRDSKQYYLRDKSELVTMTVLPTHLLTQQDHPFQIPETYPYLLIITNNSVAFYPTPLNDQSIIMEITAVEYDLLLHFQTSLSYTVVGTKEERNIQMLRFNNLLKRMKHYGYTFHIGTGIPSKREQVLPVPPLLGGR